VRQIVGYEVKEFTYESKIKRDYHVAEMELEGWQESGRKRRLKPEVNLLNATENDYQWYAHFYRKTLHPE
jgi:hypothetical protein